MTFRTIRIILEASRYHPHLPLYNLPLPPVSFKRNFSQNLCYLLSNSLSIFQALQSQMSIIPNFFGRRSNSLDLWDPFEGFPFRPLSGESSSFANATVDWKETADAHVIKADVPGLKKEEVKVEVEDDRVLQISGERNREQEEKGDTWHRVERSSGKFMRRFRLPENAKVDQVKAAMENGVLTVTVPKEEVKKPEVKNIEISG